MSTTMLRNIHLLIRDLILPVDQLISNILPWIEIQENKLKIHLSVKFFLIDDRLFCYSQTNMGKISNNCLQSECKSGQVEFDPSESVLHRMGERGSIICIYTAQRLSNRYISCVLRYLTWESYYRFVEKS